MKRQLGQSIAFFAIAGERLFTIGSKGSDCLSICIDTKTSGLIWETTISRSAYETDYSQGWGGEAFYVTASKSGLVGISASTGELKLLEETKVERKKSAIWAHPIIVGQTLYLRDQD